MSQQRLPQHRQNEYGDNCDENSRHGTDSSVPAIEIGIPSDTQGEMTPEEQQLLKLKQQEEQLKFLEEQLKSASVEAPSRSAPPSRSANRRGRTSVRRRSPGVSFCEDVFCYTNPRDYGEIVSSWYSVSQRQAFSSSTQHDYLF